MIYPPLMPKGVKSSYRQIALQKVQNCIQNAIAVPANLLKAINRYLSVMCS
jgi:hypothetical protein